jgi:hypothetical protein
MLKGTGGKFHKVTVIKKGIQVQKTWGIENPHPHQISISLSPASLFASLKSIYFIIKTKRHGRN